MKKIFLLCFFSVALFSMCIAQSLQFTKWKAYDTSSGDTLIMNFRANTYTITISSAAISIVNGEFTENGSTITLQDLSGPNACASTLLGTYEFYIINNIFNTIVQFTKVYDPCTARVTMLDSSSWNMMRGVTIRVPDDCPTIFEGIEAAHNYDTVLVTEGTYYEQINFMGKKPLIVASEFLLDGDINHISNTIIDGSQATQSERSSVVYFESGEDNTSVLCGFTIQGGKGTYWDRWQSYAGGGVYIENSSATIRNNIIRNNTLNDESSMNSMGCVGAGIAAAYGYPGWVIIENNQIINNQLQSYHNWTEGAGVYVYVTNARIANNTITYNVSSNTGYGSAVAGGLICEGDENTLIDALVIKNEISYNEAVGTFWSYGGGMAAWNLSEASLIGNNKFLENKTDGFGGAIDIYTYANASVFHVDGNFLLKNQALYGGAIDIWDQTSKFKCTNNVFSNNYAIYEGGAIWLNRYDDMPWAHMSTFINNSFYSNIADEYGGAIYSLADNPLIINSIFYGNNAIIGREIYSHYYVDTVEIANCLIDQSRIKGSVIDGYGNISGDPRFVDPVLLNTDNYSPCADAGVAAYICRHGDLVYAPLTDIAGTPRPTGKWFDIGAYDTQLMLMQIPASRAELPVSVWPNPFTGSTSFNYTLEESSQVVLQVFDSYGRMVAELINAVQQGGEQRFEWNAGNLPAGVYYCRLQSGSKAVTTKIIKTQ